MNEALIFFKVILLAFNTLIPVSFPLFKGPLKPILTWHEAVLFYFFHNLSICPLR